MKQAMNISFYDPSFFNYISKLIETFSPLDAPLNEKTNLEYQKNLFLWKKLIGNQPLKATSFDNNTW